MILAIPMDLSLITKHPLVVEADKLTVWEGRFLFLCYDLCFGQEADLDPMMILLILRYQTRLSVEYPEIQRYRKHNHQVVNSQQ